MPRDTDKPGAIVAMPSPPMDWIIGPFDVNRVVIDGRLIPRLSARHNQNGTVEIVLDERFGLTVPDHFGRQVATLVAQALAIGAGYSHLGAESKDQPFAPLAMQIETGLPR